MKQVTAIIHLVKRGRTTIDRYGKFLRPSKTPHDSATDLHLWLGRELSVAEFNEQLPLAIRSVQSTDTVYAKIIEREVEGGEPEPGDVDAAIEALKAEHEAALAGVQEGVNEFTEKHNANMQAAQARIAELEAAAVAAPIEAEQAAESETRPNPETEAESEAAAVPETISEESSGAPVVEAAPPAAGEQPAAAAEPAADAVAETPTSDKAPAAKKATAAKKK